MGSSRSYSRSLSLVSATTLLILSATFLILSTVAHANKHPNSILTVVNNCRFPIWPAIQPNSGNRVLERGGFFLKAFDHRSFPAPSQPWSGRIWARTHCTQKGPRLSCLTGDCGGRLQCNGAGGAPPSTLAQIDLHHGGPRDLFSYGVSLVDGFNVPMTVTPHKGHGQCPVVGCKANLLATCPDTLKVKSPKGVVACKSGCQAFGTDKLCCRNHYKKAQTCRASSYSQFFKHACPNTFTFAYDSPPLMHECSSPRELKVIFCP